MKSYLNNKEGSIAISSFIMSMILFLLLTSTLTLFLNDYRAVKSNTDGIKAYYLAESAMEIELYEIKGIADQVIVSYLMDLKKYKINYIENLKDENHTQQYKPPKLDTYLQKDIIWKVGSFNKTELNPFSNYPCNHSYSIHMEYDSSNNTIDILSVGIYNTSRKFLHAKLTLPMIHSNGLDEYKLPKIQVIPLQIESYCQTVGL